MLFEILLASLIQTNQGITEVSRPMYCLDSKILMKALSGEKFKEQVQWVGKSDNNLLIITINPDTKAWTLIESGPENISCVIEAGKGFENVPTKPEVKPSL